jgi:glycerol-3-phosphate dehydrogenase
VWDEIANHGGERLVGTLPYTIGEMRYCVKHEKAMTIDDLLLRRTHYEFEAFGPAAVGAVDRVAEAVGPLLGWDEGERRRQLERYSDEVARLFSVSE